MFNRLMTALSFCVSGAMTFLSVLYLASGYGSHAVLPAVAAALSHVGGWWSLRYAIEESLRSGKGAKP